MTAESCWGFEASRRIRRCKEIAMDPGLSFAEKRARIQAVEIEWFVREHAVRRAAWVTERDLAPAAGRADRAAECPECGSNVRQDRAATKEPDRAGKVP